jgi:CRISPR-associated endonuclease Cas1
MKENESHLTVFNEIKWYRLGITFIGKKNSSIMKSHPISVVQAIVKAVSSKTPGFTSLEPEIMPVFHLEDKKHTFQIIAHDQVPVEFFFFKPSPKEISPWRQNLLDYLSEAAHQQTLEILSAGEIEERNYSTLVLENTHVPPEGELCLEFLSPLPFKREKGKSRVYICKDRLIRLFEKRFSTLFNREFKYQSGQDDFSLLPYYWKYTEIKHTSKSQPGSLQYINGMIGNLYIKGKWKNLLPFLLLGSEIHIGGKLTNSQGYYRLLPDSPPYFAMNFPDPKALIPVIQDVMETYDHAAEWLSKNEMYPFNELAFAKQLCEEIKNDRYAASPNTAFMIRQKNKKDRLVEQLNFKDLIVSRYLVKTLYKIIDNCLEEESIGFRKGISREKAADLIKSALAEGYEYIIESDIENFFPSIDLNHLYGLLDFYLPTKDNLIKNLVQKLTGNGYILESEYKERSKGLALGNPLSPCLANLYLDAFDEQVKALDVRLTRYADDFVILCKSPQEAEIVLSQTQTFLSEIGLQIKKEKTAIKPVDKGFQFLGITFNGLTSADTTKEYIKLFKKPLYIAEPYVFLSLNGETAVLKKNQKIIDTIPLRRISEIMVMEKTVFSTALIRHCVENNIPFTIVLNNGYYITTIKPDSKKYYEISYAHTKKYASLANTEIVCIAAELAAGKILNYIALFKQKYNKGDHEFIENLAEIVSKVYQAGDIYQVRGLEGLAARNIFNKLNSYIKNPYFNFKKRDRRCPDPINSLLNFGYYLLFSRINASVRAVGLNPYLGFLHHHGNSYESLVCDIQELFRARIDRLILRLINLEIIKDDNFIESHRGFYLDKEGMNKFLNQFEREMNLKESKGSLSLKDHIYIQVTIIKNWVLENKSLTFYKWDISPGTGEKEK